MIKLTEEKNKSVGIFGLARTGLAAYESLRGIAKLVCFDDDRNNCQNFLSLYGGGDLRNINDPIWYNLDYIVLSPGISLRHPIVKMANLYNISITFDVEIFYNHMPQVKYIGVTGTNGKSTTTALIAHIMGDDFVPCGNIGASPLTFKPHTGYVVELSSFQLDLVNHFKPNVAVCLNITPDHLDRHGSMEEYIKAKKKLWRNMGKGDTLIIGVDNDVTANIYQALKGKVHFNLVPTSAKSKIEGMPYNKSLLGLHNMENIAASYAACLAMGKSHDEILKKIESFEGLRHRMQFICTKGKVTFYNDSKATNAEAASKSLASLDNIYWLAGGVAKEGGIESLDPLFSKIKKAYLFGEARELFAKTLYDKLEYVMCETMEQGFNLAVIDAMSSDKEANVLLAPACASFDQFKSFEHRGDEFARMCLNVSG